MLDAKNSALFEEAVRRNRKDLRQIKLCGAILTLASAIEADCSKRLGQHQLSESKFVVLIVLHESRKGLAPNELATRCGVTRATITGLIDGLERDGIVRRMADEIDRRSYQVQLTEKGQELALVVFNEHVEWLSTVFGGLTSIETDFVASLVQMLWKKTDRGQHIAEINQAGEDTATAGSAR